MSPSQLYRKRAREAVDLAGMMSLATDRDRFLLIAEQWTALAEAAERSEVAARAAARRSGQPAP